MFNPYFEKVKDWLYFIVFIKHKFTPKRGKLQHLSDFILSLLKQLCFEGTWNLKVVMSSVKIKAHLS